MKFGLLGEKLGHSFSAVIHSMIGRYEYELCPVAREDLDAFLTKRDFLGINVTIPYKKDVIPYLKELSPDARLCGAVNTVVNRGGELFGFNTDFLGMKALVEKAGIRISGKNVLILGTGGTSGTALALMEHMGAASVLRVSREKKEGVVDYSEAKEKKDVHVIINTTPCGMYPNAGEILVDLSDYPVLEGVVDAVYNPLKSRLVLEGEKRGVPSVGGLYMLVAQAVFAAQLFTGEKLPEGLVDEIFRTLKREKENVILTGMPGSGKSTLGKALAKKMGKTFYDSDEEIVKMAKKSIPDIFREEGEAHFRDLESEAIRKLSALQGAVIATGGGAVLREENILLLKGNGRILFLDAPLETLIPTSSRPLSGTVEALKARYEERYETYLSTCDARIGVSRCVEENLLLMEKELV